MTGRAVRLVAIGLVAAGAVLVLVSASGPRWSDQAGTSSGHAPAATALALVALAGAGLLLLARGAVRTVVGALLVLVGAGIVLVDLRVGSGLDTVSPVATAVAAGRTSWFWLTAVGGALVAVGGAAVAATAHRWPGPRRDFGAPRGRDRAARPARREDAWAALDRGEDPTL